MRISCLFRILKYYLAKKICNQNWGNVSLDEVIDVLGNSRLDRTKNPPLIIYPHNWFLKFTLGERLGIAVLKERVAVEEYYDNTGNPNIEAVERLIIDIDCGLWDSSFFWDIENYQNVTAASSFNNAMTQLLVVFQTVCLG